MQICKLFSQKIQEGKRIMNIKRAKKQKVTEKGVALLFSLGILGLMTVLALTFASVSMTNKDIAKLNTDKAYAKALARSILDRVCYIAEKEIKGKDLPKFYSKTTSGNNQDTYDWIWKLGFIGKDIESRLYNMEVSPISDSDLKNLYPSWQYVQEGNNATDPIVGRFAYIALAADRPLIDLNALFLADNADPISTRERYGVSMSELNPNSDFLLKGTSPLNTTTLTNEIWNNKMRLTDYYQLGSYLTSNPTDPNNLTDSDLITADTLINKLFYLPSVKYPEFFQYNNGDGVKKYHRFNLARNWAKYTDLADRQKLVQQMTGEENVLKEYVSGDEGKAPDNADIITETIPWLANWKEKDGGYDGYFAEAEKAKKKQIAANILDYFTPETIRKPTSDVDPDQWWSNGNVLYTGNKKTPYLSGLGICIKLPVQYEYKPADETAGTPITHTFTLLDPEVTPVVEYINPFGITNTGNQIKIELKGTLTFDVENPNDGKKCSYTFTIDSSSAERKYFDQVVGSENFLLQLSATNLTTFNSSKTTTGSLPVYASIEKDSLATEDLPKLNISNVQFTPEKLMLSYQYADETNPVPVDFAEFKTGSNGFVVTTGLWENLIATVPTVSDTSVTSSQRKNYNFMQVYRVTDPRHNLMGNQWKNNATAHDDTADKNLETLYKDTEAAMTYDMPAETDRDKGAPDRPPLGGNQDTYKDFMHIFASTGADLTQTTPWIWHLGAVHRAAPYQTINLTKYNQNQVSTTTADSNKTGGEKYSDGDANILDQIKVTDSPFRYGKINISALEENNVLAVGALFENLYSDTSTLEDPLAGPLDKPVAGDLATAVDGKVTAGFLFDLATLIKNQRAGTPLRSRAELLSTATADFQKIQQFMSRSTVTGITDQKQEEMIAKTMMLLEVDPDAKPMQIYVIALAQAIRDVDGARLKDWNRNGQFNDLNPSNAGSGNSIPLYEAGYQYPTPRSGFGLQRSTTVKGKYTSGTLAQKGTYENGIDQILAEQKVFAIIVKDPITNKWKIQRLQYVD